MTPSPRPEVVQAGRRAVARIRSDGVDGPRPIEEIEALLEHDAGVDDALRSILVDAAGDDLVAAIHLVSLMRRASVLDAVYEAAFESPSELAAKRVAIEAMRRCDIEPDPDVIAKLGAIDALAAAPDAGALAALLEWPEAWRTPALDAWLGAAGPEQISSVEIALGVEPQLDARLLDWISAQESAEAAQVLGRFLAGTQDKERIKQVKRALHRLRSRGIDVGDVGEDTGGGGFTLAIDESTLADAKAYVTSIDGRGARLVWLVWRAPSGGSRLLQAVVDDEHGIREAEVASVTRTGFRDYVEQMKQNPTVLLTQIPVEQASRTLAAAAHETAEMGRDLPPGFRTWAEVAGIEPAAGGDASIYEHLAATEVGADEGLIDASMTLLREPHFQSWALEGAAIDEAAEEIYQAETSTLMISDEQRRDRMQEAIRMAVRECFDDDTRSRYRGRLEVMAGMLWDRGQQDEARQALAAAIGMTEIEDLFHGHAFARAVTHRGVWLAYQDKQRELEAERQRAGIVQP